MTRRRIHTDPERTTPTGLARYSVDFLEAAVLLDDKMVLRPSIDTVASVPVLYLVGHAIELALKAFILKKGASLSDLRGYGHQLEVLWTKATSVGLGDLVSLRDEERSALVLLDDLYSTKQLEYIVTGSKTFPVHGPLEAAALKIVNAIAPAAGYPNNRLPHAS
jgi:hypothetical protein